MVKFILIKSPDEWATTKQACRDELVVYLFFSPIYILLYFHVLSTVLRTSSLHFIYICIYVYIYICIYVYIIDQAQGQDGWILAEFSFCVFMDRDEVEVHKNVKRERGQYPVILTELAWSIKDLLYGIKSTEKNDLRTCLFSSTEKEPS